MLLKIKEVKYTSRMCTLRGKIGKLHKNVVKSGLSSLVNNYREINEDIASAVDYFERYLQS